MGLALLAGCAVGGDEVPQGSPAPRAELAARAEVAAGNLSGSAADEQGSARATRDRAERSAAAREVGVDGAEAAEAEATRRGGPTSSPSAGGRAWTSLATIEDPTADHGDGPAYADLVTVDFGERDGTLAVTLGLGDLVPGRLADREVEGIGVDLFRSSSDESDYQVFLDGGRHGWRAFLQTPGGFVRFPGSLVVAGRTLRVTLPWESLGGRREADVSVFVDWSSGVGRLSSDGTTRVRLEPDR